MEQGTEDGKGGVCKTRASRYSARLSRNAGTKEEGSARGSELQSFTWMSKHWKSRIQALLRVFGGQECFAEVPSHLGQCQSLCWGEMMNTNNSVMFTGLK
jgi:hypothetical protein